MVSTSYAWIFGIVTLFGLGVLFIVFSQVFTANLVPTIKDMIDNSTTITPAVKAETKGGIDQYMTFFKTLPFIMFIIVCIYMLVAAIRKEGESNF